MSAKGKRFSIEKLRKTLMGAKVYHETRGKGEIIGLSDLTAGGCTIKVRFKSMNLISPYAFPGDFHRHVLSTEPFGKGKTVQKSGSPKPEAPHTVDMKLESFKRQFKIHEKERITYEDSKIASGGQVIRFEKSIDNQKVTHYYVVALLDIDSYTKKKHKFPFPEICSKGFMKRELPEGNDENPQSEPPVSMKEKEKVEEPEKTLFPQRMNPDLLL